MTDNQVKVPFVNFPLQYGLMKGEIDHAIQNCLERGDLINRQDLKLFEHKFSEYCDVKHGIGTLHGTDALFLSLKVLGIGPGDEVITVDHTYIATIDVIIACGATPVLIDVEYDSMNMNMDLLEEAITPNTKAVIPVHLNGRMCDMERCLEITNRHNLFVVEDACQAAGASFKGRKAGSWGDLGCFSFYPSKPLGSYGEGGMIVTDNDMLANKLRKLQHHGDEPGKKRGTIHCWGYNSILENITAAILNVKLPYLDGWNERRRDIAERYFNLLSASVIVPLGFVELYFSVFNNIFAYFTIKARDRDGLKKHLDKCGIGTMIYLETSNHKQEALTELHKFKLPVTEKLSKECLSLPMYPELTEAQISHVIQSIKEFYN